MSFYSKEKLITDGEYILSEGHLSESGGGSGFAPQIEYWPNLTFELVEGFDPLDGDINADGLINILDVLITVDLILTYEYNPIVDLNSDDIINVIDILIFIQLILEQ